jgi:hypothetical protein
MVTASEVEAKLKEKLDAADVVGAQPGCAMAARRTWLCVAPFQRHVSSYALRYTGGPATECSAATSIAAAAAAATAAVLHYMHVCSCFADSAGHLRRVRSINSPSIKLCSSTASQMMGVLHTEMSAAAVPGCSHSLCWVLGVLLAAKVVVFVQSLGIGSKPRPWMLAKPQTPNTAI